MLKLKLNFNLEELIDNWGMPCDSPRNLQETIEYAAGVFAQATGESRLTIELGEPETSHLQDGESLEEQIKQIILDSIDCDESGFFSYESYLEHYAVILAAKIESDNDG